MNIRSENAADVSSRFDLVVIGANPAGIAAAVRAAREGLTVVLTQHTHHVGGLLTNGIVQLDALTSHLRCPIFRELIGAIETHYREQYGEGSPQHRSSIYTIARYPTSMVEPKVAEQVLEAMLAAEPRVAVWRGMYPESVTRGGKLITSVAFRSMTGTDRRVATAPTFVDATYEGDLMKLAGAEYQLGREGREKFGEPHAGQLFTNIIHAAEAPKMEVEGRLAVRVYEGRMGKTDPRSPQTGDRAVQAYNMRPALCNDPANRTMIEAPPEHYDRSIYVNFTRKYLSHGEGSLINSKGTCNSAIMPGENWDYPEADWPRRDEITRKHRDFMLGLIYFMQNDPSMPEPRREFHRQWGLPGDEYTDNGHLPYEMYVRETRRLIGRHVLNENDLLPREKFDRPRPFADSVAFTDWYMDSHSCSRDFGTHGPGKGIVGSERYPFDGKLVLTEELRPGMIPYRCLLPVGIDNLIVPVCASATHLAWGAIRLEPAWVHLGEVTGFAAALAARDRTTVAGLSVSTLQHSLLAAGASIAFFNQHEAMHQRPGTAELELAACHGEHDSFDL